MNHKQTRQRQEQPRKDQTIQNRGASESGLYREERAAPRWSTSANHRRGKPTGEQVQVLVVRLITVKDLQE